MNPLSLISIERENFLGSCSFWDQFQSTCVGRIFQYQKKIKLVWTLPYLRLLFSDTAGWSVLLQLRMTIWFILTIISKMWAFTRSDFASRILWRNKCQTVSTGLGVFKGLKFEDKLCQRHQNLKEASFGKIKNKGKGLEILGKTILWELSKWIRIFNDENYSFILRIFIV